MTSHQIDLLKKTFKIIDPLRGHVSKLFYDKLFVSYPALRSMFKNDITVQGEKLIATIELLVFSFEKTDGDNYQIIGAMIKPLENMGRQHHELGVQPNQYNIVADILLWTFEKALGEDFTSEVRAAWAEAYALLAEVMIQGATNKSSLPA